MSAYAVNAEQAAQDLLRSVSSAQAGEVKLPVNPYEIAAGLGIRVEFEPLPLDQSGKITMFENEQPGISINSFDSLNRQRFTCAHELGHYWRRVTDPNSSKRHFVDYRATLASAGTDPDEVYANQFAASLLMPADLVKRWNTSENLSKLARRFETSEQAMELRLRNLWLR